MMRPTNSLETAHKVACILATEEVDGDGVPNDCLEKEHACQRFHLVLSDLVSQTIFLQLLIHVCRRQKNELYMPSGQKQCTKSPGECTHMLT